MFRSYVLLKSLHVLLVAVWLGMDFGTFYTYRRLRDSSLSIETRKQMYRVFAFLDMGPRTALVLMLTLGVGLSYLGRWGFTGSSGRIFAIVTAIVGVLWVAALWHQHWVHSAPSGFPRAAGHVKTQQIFRLFDIWLRLGLAGGLAVAAVISLVGESGVIAVDWLAWKLVLFAGIVLSGVGIRLFLPKIASALGEIFTNGSTPQSELALTAASRKTIGFVFAIWAFIILIVWVTVAK